MKNLIKSHTLLLSLALCLSAVLSYSALEKDSCFEISVNERIKIKAGCKFLLFQER